MCCLASDPNQPKLFKIQPSPATPSQRISKKKAWFSLDSLVRIEPFQRVIVTPRAKNLTSAPSPCDWPRPNRAFAPEHAPKITRASDFRKQDPSAPTPFAGDQG